MKKVWLFIVLVVFSCSTISALHPSLKEFSIEDSSLMKSRCWDATKKWVAITMDSYNARIAYEKEENGEMIVKGRCKDSNNRMWSVQNSFVIPYLEYEIEITMRDGYYSAKYTKIKYYFKSSYGESTYGMSELMLIRMRNELEVIEELLYSIGDTWEVDAFFEKEYNLISEKIKEAEQKKNDKSLRKKERKEYGRIYEENVGKDAVYHSVKNGAHRLVYDTFYEESLGLRQLIKILK